MKKRILSFLLVAMMLLTMMPMTTFAEETEMSEDFKSILNDDLKLEVTWSSDEEYMPFILSEWVLCNHPDVNGSFYVVAYNDSTKKVTLRYCTTFGTEEVHDVDVVINEEFSAEFNDILTNGKLILPTTCENVSMDWLSSYLSSLGDVNTDLFSVANGYDITTGETFACINDDFSRAVIKLGRADGYCEFHTVELSRISEMSDDFKAYLSSNGKIELDAAPPQNEWDFYALFELMIYDEGVFHYNVAEDYTSFDLSINDEMHTVEIVYNYDASIAAKMRGYLENLPMDELFAVRDLELVNYWVNTANADEADTLDAYSGDLKEYIGYSNIKYYVDNRMGTDEPFYIERVGIAMFLYNDTVYYVNNMIGTYAEHVIYVPDNTANTSAAMMEAAQKRIDEYIGADKVELIPVGTVFDVLESVYPGESEDVLQDLIFAESISGDDFAYKLTVKGESGQEKAYYVVIKCDSSKMITPDYKTVDVKNNVEVSSESSEVPLDTRIEAEVLTSGTEYNKIIGLLDVKENVTYDISLYSDSLSDNVTKLENGTFEVKIPLTEELKGKELVAYYVDENDNIIKYPVTQKNGYAIFNTNHFSIYTLAEGSTSGSGEATPQPEYEVEAPSTNVASGKLIGDVFKVVEQVPFTDAEKALIDAGADVKITLEVKDATSTVTDTEKTLIQSNLGDNKVGMYMDINMYKQIGDEEAIKILDLNGKVKVQLTLPDLLIENEDDINRVYSVIDIHDGDVEVLEAKFDETTKYLTFETNHFSTYVVVYKDVAVVPPTGDNTSVLPWTCMLLVGAGAIVVSKKRKHE